MAGMLKKAGKYLVYILWSNVIYGLIVYFTFTWLVRHSLLLGYFGNLVLIIIGLVMDAYMQRYLQSETLAVQLRDEKSRELNFRFIRFITDSFVSFKTILYLFYVVILIFSQIINFSPDLLSENIRVFISANDYSILLLVSLDTLIVQFTKDKEKMRAVSAKLKDLLDDDGREQ